MPQLTDHPSDRRSGIDRRRSDAIPDAAGPDAAGDRTDPIAAWNVAIPTALRRVASHDPWTQVVHRSILDEHDGRHDEAIRVWDEAVVWSVNGHDPTGRGEARGSDEIVAYHRALGRLTDWTFGQELVSVEGNRGPIVEAHVRTKAQRAGRSLDIPTLLVFELAGLRVRRVTEIPGDVAAWDAFWQD